MYGNLAICWVRCTKIPVISESSLAYAQGNNRRTSKVDLIHNSSEGDGENKPSTVSNTHVTT